MIDSKECTKCGHSLPLSSFSKDKKAKHGLSYYCKTCASLKTKEQRLKRRKNPEYIKQFNAKITEANKLNKRAAVEYMGNSCFDCGGSFPDSVYDFHHLDMSTKEMNPSRVLRLKDRTKVMAELDKCVLLCANCHRIRHFEKDL